MGRLQQLERISSAQKGPQQMNLPPLLSSELLCSSSFSSSSSSSSSSSPLASLGHVRRYLAAAGESVSESVCQRLSVCRRRGYVSLILLLNPTLQSSRRTDRRGSSGRERRRSSSGRRSRASSRLTPSPNERASITISDSPLSRRAFSPQAETAKAAKAT